MAVYTIQRYVAPFITLTFSFQLFKNYFWFIWTIRFCLFYKVSVSNIWIYVIPFLSFMIQLK